MPLARIRTADPVSVADLASELRESGYEFEFARPDEQCAYEADVEIRAESMPIQQAFDRAYEMNNGGIDVYVAPGLLEPADAPPQAETDIRIEHSSRSSEAYDLPEAIPYSQSINLDSQQPSARFDSERSSDKRSRLAESIAGMRGMVEGTINNFRERQAERASRRNSESAARAEEAAALRQKQLQDLAVQREEARKRREEYERQQEQDRLAQEQRERELAVQRERALALQRERDAEDARRAAELQRKREEEQRHRDAEQRQREAREAQLRMEEAKRAAEAEKLRAEEQRQQEIADAARLQQEAKLRQEYERTLAEERQRREQQFAQERERELQARREEARREEARREEARREEERREKARLEQVQRQEQAKRLEEARREEERHAREAQEQVARREQKEPLSEVIDIGSLPVRYVDLTKKTERPTPEPVGAEANATKFEDRTDEIHEAPSASDHGFAAVPLAHPVELGNRSVAERQGRTHSISESLLGDGSRQRAFQLAAVAAAIIAIFAMGIWAAVSGRKPADPLNLGGNVQPNIQQATPFGPATAVPRQVQEATPAARSTAPTKLAVTTTKPTVAARAPKPPAHIAKRKPSPKKRTAVAKHKKESTTRTARRSRDGVKQYSDMD